jgi:hypothetical protein
LIVHILKIKRLLPARQIRRAHRGAILLPYPPQIPGKKQLRTPPKKSLPDALRRAPRAFNRFLPQARFLPASAGRRSRLARPQKIKLLSKPPHIFYHVCWKPFRHPISTSASKKKVSLPDGLKL